MRRKHVKYKADHKGFELASMCFALNLNCLRFVWFGMFADTVSFSLQSYHISHAVIMKSIGDNKLKPQLSICALLTVKKKLENTMQVVLKQARVLKDPLHIKLPLVLPTTSQIQELAPQFLHIL